MRTITAHHDGLGLNDIVTIIADDRDQNAGNASHCYLFTTPELPDLARIQFQHGGRNMPGSTLGVLDSAVLQVVIDRYEGFQSGPFASEEGAIVLNLLRQAKAMMTQRAVTRQVQRVLGQNAAHKTEG